MEAGAFARVHATRRRLIGMFVARALMGGAAAGLAALLAAAAMDIAFGIPLRMRETVPLLALVVAIAVTLVMLRTISRLSIDRVALWIEERTPALQYALVTALDPHVGSAGPRLEGEVRATRWEHRTAAGMRRATLLPSAALALTAILLLLIPGWAMQRVIDATPGDSLLRPPARSTEAVDPFANIVVSVTPPAYTGQRAFTLDNPFSVSSLEGSSVEVRGRGVAEVQGELSGRTTAATALEDGWRLRITMPGAPAALRLYSPSGDRLIALEPQTDSAPTVILLAPVRDSVLREPTGRIQLRAEGRDDFGIAAAAFEVLVTSGQGEIYSFRGDTIGQLAERGRRTFSIGAALQLESMELVAGDVVHIRAYAQDANNTSGPGVGVSETRTLRIARAGEYDSLAIDGAPPPDVDQSALSQRMLIQQAESLVQRAPRMSRTAVVAESRRISADQKRLRQRVGEIVFMRMGGEMEVEHTHGPGEVHTAGDISPTELLRAAERAAGAIADATGRPLDFHGDETPVVAINRPLLEAYNHMWDASRELDIGEPERALGPMRLALAAIQGARQAERIYLRGRPPGIVVDVPAARMQGSDRGVDAQRDRRAALESARAMWAARLSRAISVLDTDRGAGADSLTLLRIELLRESPELAAVLGSAIDAIRGGRDSREALAGVRRALVRGAGSRDALPAWGGGG
jgi:hypothetical protein